jgi:hypothetical protein
VYVKFAEYNPCICVFIKFAWFPDLSKDIEMDMGNSAMRVVKVAVIDFRISA